jgi:hypothetical protein
MSHHTPRTRRSRDAPDDRSDRRGGRGRRHGDDHGAGSCVAGRVWVPEGVMDIEGALVGGDGRHEVAGRPRLRHAAHERDGPRDPPRLSRRRDPSRRADVEGRARRLEPDQVRHGAARRTCSDARQARHRPSDRAAVPGGRSRTRAAHAAPPPHDELGPAPELAARPEPGHAGSRPGRAVTRVPPRAGHVVGVPAEPGDAARRGRAPGGPRGRSAGLGAGAALRTGRHLSERLDLGPRPRRPHRRVGAPEDGVAGLGAAGVSRPPRRDVERTPAHRGRLHAPDADVVHGEPRVRLPDVAERP